jgi:hypothetical protein
MTTPPTYRLVEAQTAAQFDAARSLIEEFLVWLMAGVVLGMGMIGYNQSSIRTAA